MRVSLSRQFVCDIFGLKAGFGKIRVAGTQALWYLNSGSDDGRDGY